MLLYSPSHSIGSTFCRFLFVDQSRIASSECHGLRNRPADRTIIPWGEKGHVRSNRLCSLSSAETHCICWVLSTINRSFTFCSDRWGKTGDLYLSDRSFTHHHCYFTQFQERLASITGEQRNILERTFPTLEERFSARFSQSDVGDNRTFASSWLFSIQRSKQWHGDFPSSNRRTLPTGTRRSKAPRA